jgi:DNA-binding winged helix-turn-helix (wHTH) protein
MTTRISNEKFSFSEFEAIPQANLLIKRSRKKRLEPKVMSLLVLLASKNGEVVTRGEILTALWPNIIVGDEVISQLVYSLRNALTDDAKNPKYIETIPKKGYRFIAEVNMTEAEQSTTIDNKEITDTTKNKSQVNLNKKWLISSCLLLISVLIFAWLLSNNLLQKNVNNLKIQNILPITQDVGVEGGFSFHKNHKKMIYVSSQVDRVDIYMRVLGEAQSEQITNDEWVEYSPLWLDEQTITYIRKKSGLFQIIRHTLPTEAEIIYESDNAIFNLVLKGDEDSSIGFIEYDDYQHNKLHEIKSINWVNKKVTYLHESILNLPSDIRSQVYSLDGQTLYFFNNTNEVKEIVSLDLKSNQYKSITDQFSSVEHIALLDSGNLLISGEVSVTKGIWQLNISNHAIESILPSSGGQRITRAKLKQGQIYYATYKAPVNQVIADITQQTFDYLPKLNSDANEYFGVYSKDNKTIYFVSNRTGYYEVWSYNLKTQKTKQVTQLQANFIHRPTLSNTESFFAVVYEKEELTLSIISLITGKPVKERTIPSMKYPLAWSENDSSIYISEHVKSVNIYQYDTNTLEPTLIQINAGLFAKENTDRNSLTLIDYKVGGLIRRNVNNGKKTSLMNDITSLNYLVPGELKAVEQSIFAVIKDGPLRKIQEYTIGNDAQSPSSKLLMNLPNWSRVTDFNLDGSKVIFFKSSPPEGDIMSAKLEH